MILYQVRVYLRDISSKANFLNCTREGGSWIVKFKKEK